MSRTANINLRIDPSVKADAQALFANFGLSVTDAINIFLHQSLIVGGLPFEVRQAEFSTRYNATTEKAMDEARDILSGKVQAKSYNSLSEILSEISD